MMQRKYATIAIFALFYSICSLLVDSSFLRESSDSTQGISRTLSTIERTDTEPLDAVCYYGKSGKCWQVYIVYSAFINTKRSNWLELIQQQLTNLSDVQLAKKATQIHVAISVEFIAKSSRESKDSTESNVQQCVNTVKTIIPNALITLTLKNLYEYPAILKVWELGQAIPNLEVDRSVVLYFHSKGMNNGKLSVVRDPVELELFDTVVRPWRNIIEIFSNNTQINKVVHKKAKAGFGWYNFWWARAAYIRRLAPPTPPHSPKDRYQYEEWLCHVSTRPQWPWPDVVRLNIFHQEDFHLGNGHHDSWSLTSTTNDCFDPTIDGDVPCDGSSGKSVESVRISHALSRKSRSTFSSGSLPNGVVWASKQPRVVGFWNVFSSGPHFRQIVDEQRNIIISSGLLDKVDVINYLTWGIEGLNLTFPEEKFHHLIHQEHGSELDTLNHLYQHCKANLDDKVFYFHNKGSFHNNKGNEDFRFALDCFNLNPHCIATLNEFDTCGLRISPIPHPHYSGNFWWATCKHVSKLINPYSPRHNETFKSATAKILQPPYTKDDESAALGLARFFAETWVTSAPQFRPADCLEGAADSSYLYGSVLPSEPIKKRCPGESGYGMKCGVASTMISSAKFRVVFDLLSPKPWEAHLRKLVDRSLAWYGEPPHTLLEWNTLFTVVDYDESQSSQLYPDGRLLRAPGQRTVYLMQSGKKLAFMSDNAFMSRGLNFSHCDIIDFVELAKIPDGEPLY